MNVAKTMENLKKRGFTVSYFDTAAQAADYLDRSIDSQSVGVGGSVTLRDMGVYEKLAAHNDCLLYTSRIPEYYDVVHQHQWKDLGRIRSIYGSVITVVGTGDIGTAFAQRAKALGAAHIRGVHRTNKVLPRCFDESYAVEDLDFALAGADIVVLCVPGTKETEHLITRERLGLLKDVYKRQSEKGGASPLPFLPGSFRRTLFTYIQGGGNATWKRNRCIASPAERQDL